MYSMFPSPHVGEPPFRLGIVGAGLITRNTHLPTALSIPGIEVVAIVDPVIDRARALVVDYGLAAKALADAVELTSLCDGAIVATPNHTHCTVAVPLLEAGVSTLIEKPLATTAEEARQILAAASKGKAKVAIGHYQRFLDAPRLLARLVQSKHFGRISRFYHQFGTPGGWPAMSAYTLQRASIGGGVLVVTGTHFLDRMLSMWGMPDDVALRDDAGTGPEAHCEARASYRDKGDGALRGDLRYSKCVPLPAGLAMETEAGMVMLRDGFADRITVWARGRTGLRSEIVSEPDAAFPAGFDPNQRMLWDFVTACRTGREPVVDGRQGLQLMELLQRFYEHRQPLQDDWAECFGRAA
jgi:predicted dehydrogenase